MRKVVFSWMLILTLNNIGFTQELTSKEGDSFLESDEVQIENAPNFYSKYFSEQALNSNWILRTERIQSNFDGASYIEMPLLMKHHLMGKFNFFFGPKLNIFKTKEETQFNLSYSFGLEYNANENVIIEARFNYLLTDEFQNPEFQTHYQSGSDTSFTLGSRFKF